MAIEVIERGNPPAEKIFRRKCPGCHSLLQFKRSDGKFTSGQRDGDFLVIECPVCQRSIFHSSI